MKIISNEHNTNYSLYIINHILENSKNDDLIYRNIDIHTRCCTKYDDTNKDIFLTKNGDTMQSCLQCIFKRHFKLF